MNEKLAVRGATIPKKTVKASAVERPQRRRGRGALPPHPMQPIIVAEGDILRFRPNKIIESLFYAGRKAQTGCKR